MSIYTSLIGTSNMTAGQIDNHILLVNPTVPRLGEYYVRFGRVFGLRHDIAAAQMAFETNYLRFTGQVRPEWHNPAGLNSRQGGFQKFATWEQGVHAHFERLNCYVRPSDPTGEGGKYDDNYGHWRYNELIRRFGRADRLIDVAQLWAETPAEQYAQNVWNIREKIVTTPGEEPVEPFPMPLPWLIILMGLAGIGYAIYKLIR